jgi:hypothetical protein
LTVDAATLDPFNISQLVYPYSVCRDLLVFKSLMIMYR